MPDGFDVDAMLKQKRNQNRGRFGVLLERRVDLAGVEKNFR